MYATTSWAEKEEREKGKRTSRPSLESAGEVDSKSHVGEVDVDQAAVDWKEGGWSNLLVDHTAQQPWPVES